MMTQEGNPVKLYFKPRVPGRLHTHTYLLHTHRYQNGQETNAKSIPSQAWYVAREPERAGADKQARLSGPSMADTYVHPSCSSDPVLRPLEMPQYSWDRTNC